MVGNPSAICGRGAFPAATTASARGGTERNRFRPQGRSGGSHRLTSIFPRLYNASTSPAAAAESNCARWASRSRSTIDAAYAIWDCSTSKLSWPQLPNLSREEVKARI